MMRASGNRTSAGKRRMAGSLKRLKRKGRTASSRSGPPRFISTTAMRPISMVDWLSKELGESLNVFRRCLRQHAVPEIENIISSAEHPTQSPHRFFEGRSSGNQQDGIEITLNRPVRLQFFARIHERHRRIETDPGNPSLPQIVLVQDTGATWETNNGAMRETCFQGCNDALCRLDHPTYERPLRKRSSPAIEQLNYLGACFDLARQVLDRTLGK